MNDIIESVKWIYRSLFFGCIALLLIINLSGCTSQQSQPNLTCNPAPCICNPVIKEVPIEKIVEKPVDKIVYQINTSCEINKLDCQNKRQDLVLAYSKCLFNLSDINSKLDGDCYSKLQSCNETLIDYTGRLDNITHYAKDNR